MSKARRKRMTYTEGQRRTILLAAQKEGLTALQVQKRFGVKPITYYSWRKKRGVAARRGGRRTLALLAGSGDIGIQVRSAVQSRIRQVLPEQTLQQELRRRRPPRRQPVPRGLAVPLRLRPRQRTLLRRRPLPRPASRRGCSRSTRPRRLRARRRRHRRSSCRVRRSRSESGTPRPVRHPRQPA